MNTDKEFRERNYLNPELKEMFFALDLIESYGSGIRRAKNAMEANHSPELLFEPNNETDDYTMVTAYINEEFARIHEKEKGKDKVKKLDTTQKKSSNTRNRIIEIMRNNPEVTQAEIASLLDITIDGVKYQIKKMKIKSFKYYDRMLPAQDHVPGGGVGNLIALPLQGESPERGEQCFY